MINCDVAIIGAGAAGMMCAAEAGKRGRKVMLLDHGKAAGEKIRISGGGRCNFTNLHCSPANFLSDNPRFCISALTRYTQFDFIELVRRYRIAFHEKTLGQLFCDTSSKQIIDMLLEECKQAGVNLSLQTSVHNIRHADGKFILTLANGQSLYAESLVLATGGLSIPKMGATGFAYDIARQFGLAIIPLRPALVPFTFSEDNLKQTKPLAGISFHSKVSCGKTTFEEASLFTHRGMSGPAILQISSYWREGQQIIINLAPATDIIKLLQQARQASPKQEITTALVSILPKRLAQYICDTHHITGRLADLSNRHSETLAQLIHGWTIIPDGTEGYRTAEVTAGGIDTKELSSQTMEAVKVKGLYAIGEAVDVTGHLGGFNFQWAWSSGYAAGQHA